MCDFPVVTFLRVHLALHIEQYKDTTFLADVDTLKNRIFRMMRAMKRPEVQEGLGILMELATVVTAVKSDPESSGCLTRKAG